MFEEDGEYESDEEGGKDEELDDLCCDIQDHWFSRDFESAVREAKKAVEHLKKTNTGSINDVFLVYELLSLSLREIGDYYGASKYLGELLAHSEFGTKLSIGKQQRVLRIAAELAYLTTNIPALLLAESKLYSLFNALQEAEPEPESNELYDNKSALLWDLVLAIIFNIDLLENTNHSGEGVTNFNDVVNNPHAKALSQDLLNVLEAWHTIQFGNAGEGQSKLKAFAVRNSSPQMQQSVFTGLANLATTLFVVSVYKSDATRALEVLEELQSNSQGLDASVLHALRLLASQNHEELHSQIG